jgi:hypothetical protein
MHDAWLVGSPIFVNEKYIAMLVSATILFISVMRNVRKVFYRKIDLPAFVALLSRRDRCE